MVRGVIALTAHTKKNAAGHFQLLIPPSPVRWDTGASYVSVWPCYVLRPLLTEASSLNWGQFYPLGKMCQSYGHFGSYT